MHSSQLLQNRNFFAELTCALPFFELNMSVVLIPLPLVRLCEHVAPPLVVMFLVLCLMVRKQEIHP